MAQESKRWDGVHKNKALCSMVAAAIGLAGTYGALGKLEAQERWVRGILRVAPLGYNNGIMQPRVSRGFPFGEALRPGPYSVGSSRSSGGGGVAVGEGEFEAMRRKMAGLRTLAEGGEWSQEQQWNEGLEESRPARRFSKGTPVGHTLLRNRPTRGRWKRLRVGCLAAKETGTQTKVCVRS